MDYNITFVLKFIICYENSHIWSVLGGDMHFLFSFNHLVIATLLSIWMLVLHVAGLMPFPDLLLQFKNTCRDVSESIRFGLKPSFKLHKHCL